MLIKNHSNMSDSKHKVAFYLVLVILLVTLRHCHGGNSTAEVVARLSSNDLPENANEIMPFAELQRSYADKSVAEKLVEMRRLLRSFFFDWSLGTADTEIAGRTFGRIRMMRQLLIPAAFLGGFLTAVIMGIKVIGVVNMLLITGVLVLNLAVILGKLFFWKLGGHHHGHHGHHHHHPPPYYGGYSYASAFADRADSSLPYRRNLNSPFVPNFPGSQSPGFSQSFGFFPSGQLFNQPQNFGSQPGFDSSAPGQLFSQPQSAFPSQISPQQPPTSFQSQPHNSSPFGGIQMQIPQQLLQQQQQQRAPTTPATEIEMLRLQELPSQSSIPSMNPMDILDNALERMEQLKKTSSGASRLPRFRRRLSLLKPLT